MALMAGLLVISIAVTYLVSMPDIDLNSLIPQEAEVLSEGNNHSVLYALFVVLSSLLYLPVVVMITHKLYPMNPNALLMAGTFFVLALVLEIVNN